MPCLKLECENFGQCEGSHEWRKKTERERQKGNKRIKDVRAWEETDS